MSFVSRIAASAALGALLCGAAIGAHAQDLEPPAGTAPIVGMAFDDDGDLWLAGIDASEGIVTAADDGREVSFSGNPESVQALAFKDERLWIGDIGDVQTNRDFVVVFRLNSLAEETSSYNAFDFEYEDGPRDAKAMLISGRGRIHIITTGDNPGIYRAPLEPSRQEMNTLERVADAPAGVSDGTFLADGTTMVLRTDTGLEYIDALTWEPTVTETLVGAPEDESVAVDADDEVHVGGNPTIRSGAVIQADTTTTVGPSAEPESPSASPTAAVSPTASSPAASASSAPATTATTPGSTAPGRTGTLIALIAAAVVSLAAGAIVAIRRT